MLQPLDYDPNEKNKHKFMVQSMFAPDGVLENQENLWKDISPENLMDSKLKCVFELPVEQGGDSQTSPEKSNTQKTPEKTPKASNIEQEFKRIAEENKRLQSELSQTKEAKNKLEEDRVRLRKLAQQDTVSSTPQTTHTMSLEPPASSIPSALYLVIALILGYIIGKFIL